MPLATKTKNNDTYLISELNIRSVNRGRKDIGNWRSAQIAAESVVSHFKQNNIKD